MHEWRLNTRTGVATERGLPGGYCDFPFVPQRCEGLKTRFVYAQSFSKGLENADTADVGLMDSVLRFDLESGEVLPVSCVRIVHTRSALLMLIAPLEPVDAAPDRTDTPPVQPLSADATEMVPLAPEPVLSPLPIDTPPPLPPPRLLPPDTDTAPPCALPLLSPPLTDTLLRTSDAPAVAPPEICTQPASPDAPAPL